MGLVRFVTRNNKVVRGILEKSVKGLKFCSGCCYTTATESLEKAFIYQNLSEYSLNRGG